MAKTVEQMEDEVRRWAVHYPGYIREDAPLMQRGMKPTVVKPVAKQGRPPVLPVEAAQSFKCGYCPRTFERERGVLVHQSQCASNPSAHKWTRSKRKHRGARPGNQNARKHPKVLTSMTPGICPKCGCKIYLLASGTPEAAGVAKNDPRRG